MGCTYPVADGQVKFSKQWRLTYCFNVVPFLYIPVRVNCYL